MMSRIVTDRHIWRDSQGLLGRLSLGQALPWSSARTFLTVDWPYLHVPQGEYGKYGSMIRMCLSIVCGLYTVYLHSKDDVAMPGQWRRHLATALA